MLHRTMRMERGVPWIVLLCLLSGCGDQSRPNILLIVIDTLRADRLGCYGNRNALTPFFDSLAGRRATVFWNAFAQSSWTSPSVASLFTSRYPSQHGVSCWTSVLPQPEQTLATVLRGSGFATAAFVANPLLTAKLGYAQGFETFRVFPEDSGSAPDFLLKERAEVLNRSYLAWLDARQLGPQRSQPVFVWLHYMEPHPPYRPPQALLDQVLARGGHREPQDAPLAHPQPSDPWATPDQSTLEVMKNQYDAEVMSIDTQLRQLFEDLEHRGFLDHTMVVLTADHGEEFMDHGHYGHGKTLYNEVTHVPLLVMLPGRRDRAEVRDIVSLLDVAPTILEVSGVSAPAAFEGRSFRPIIHPDGWLSRVRGWVDGHAGARREPPVTLSQLNECPGHIPLRPRRHDAAIIVGSQKLIVGPAGNETYDLDADPDERHARGLSAPDERALLQTLQSMMARAQRDSHHERLEAADEATKQRMKALGYGD